VDSTTLTAEAVDLLAWFLTDASIGPGSVGSCSTLFDTVADPPG
jgi:hypothetical protein